MNLIRNNVGSLDSVNINCYRSGRILFVHSCVLVLVHILDRCHKTEKRILQGYFEMSRKRIWPTQADISLQCLNWTCKIYISFLSESDRMGRIHCHNHDRYLESCLGLSTRISDQRFTIYIAKMVPQIEPSCPSIPVFSTFHGYTRKSMYVFIRDMHRKVGLHP